MLKETLTEYFERDLNKLKEELMLYKNENDLWIVRGGINNSAGNLFLHLMGNLNHFIGAALGASGYVRDRESEFTLKNIPREKILEGIEKTIPVVINTLGRLSDEDLQKDFPLQKHGEKLTTQQMLIHLVTHLSYHLGQINYHRRLLGRLLD